MSTITDPATAADRAAEALRYVLGDDLVDLSRRVVPATAGGALGAIVQLRALVRANSEAVYDRAWEAVSGAADGDVHGDEVPWVIWILGVTVVVDVDLDGAQ